MSGRPAVTVVMAVRDGERTLAAALDSLLDQSLDDLEIVVVDDGSRDGSAEVLATYRRRDPRIILMRQPALGLARALNAGFARARSELVARMDADDVARPERLERQLGFLEEHPSVAVVGGAARLFGDAGRFERCLTPPTRPDAIRERLLVENALIHPSVMLRRSVWEAVGGYRAQFPASQDYDLWLRVAEAHDLANLGEPVLIDLRLHADQLSTRSVELQVLARLGARLAADRRRLGAADPLASVARLDRSVLLELGLEERAIDEAVAAALVDRAELLLSLGLTQAARVPAAQLERSSAGHGGCAARREWVLARLAFRSRRRRRALGHLLRAGFEQPVTLARQLARAGREWLEERRRGAAQARGG